MKRSLFKPFEGFNYKHAAVFNFQKSVCEFSCIYSIHLVDIYHASILGSLLQ